LSNFSKYINKMSELSSLNNSQKNIKIITNNGYE
jgi:hypothetical protein